MCLRMRALREKAGMTQYQVAEALSVSQAAYSRLEKGEVEVSLSKLIALSEFFDVPLSDLINGI